MSLLRYLSHLVFYTQSLLCFCIIALCISHSKKVSVVNTLFRKLSLSFHAKKEKAFGMVKEIKLLLQILKVYEITEDKDNVH